MGWRFRKSINLGGGLRLNLSKSGIGISGGVRGARVGVGPRGLRANVGIPGTGIYYEKRSSLGKRTVAESITSAPQQIRVGFLRSLTMDKGERALVEAINAALRQEQGEAAVKARAALLENPNLADAHFLLALMTSDSLVRYQAVEGALANHKQYGKYFNRYEITLLGNLELTDELTLQIANDELGLVLLAAEVFQEQGQWQRAQELLQSSPFWSEPVVKLALGEIYYGAGEYQRCIEVLQAVENEDSVGTTALLYLGLAFREQDYLEAALDAFSRGLRRRKGRDPELLLEVRYQRARIYEELGQRAKAKGDYERILAEDAAYEDVQERLTTL